ncbi:STAS domain-containing protein [bacterium]|jgi:anti-anti-sigma factor|nr:STAS domain-containing protein [bacterium]
MSEEQNTAIDSLVQRRQAHPGGIVYISLNDDLKYSHLSAFRGLFIKEFGEGNRKMILDLHKVNYLVSAQLGLIWSFKQDAEDSGGDVVFIGLSELVHEAFDSMGLLDQSEIFETEEEALGHFQA